MWQKLPERLFMNTGMILVLTVAGANACAQIVTGPTGSGLLTFDTAPPANQWTSRSYGGDNGGAGILTPAQLDSEVQLVDATAVTNVLATTTVVPPTQNNFARWNSTGHYLQSRIGNVEFTVLLAKVVNRTGVHVDTIGIRYDFGGGGIFGQESIFGFRVFYSHTGTPGSWLLIPELAVASTGMVATVVSMISEGGWPQDATLFLLWADDNGQNSDPYYTIDNLEVTVAPRVQIQRSGTGILLSWKVAWEGFGIAVQPTLESSIPATFHPASEASVSNGCYHLFFPASSGEQYFRLRNGMP